jgi:SH3 domain protein
LLCWAPGAVAQTLYVSDELSVALRSGASTQHRILAFITSGTALDVVGSSEDGEFYQVTADGKEGWVKAEYVMQSPSARAQLPTLNQRIDELKAALKNEKTTLAELRDNIRALEANTRALEKERDSLNNNLETIKQVAAHPVAIAQQNQQLQAELSNTSQALALEQAENAVLRDRNIKEWFVVGGGVALASVFFGLIIPNIRWRRKRDSWGGGF